MLDHSARTMLTLDVMKFVVRKGEVTALVQSGLDEFLSLGRQTQP